MAQGASLLLAMGLWLAVSSVWAGSFQVSPIRLQLSLRERATALHLANTGDTALVLHAEVMHWSQDTQGQDLLEPSNDLVLSPPVVNLPPGGQQVVRLARLAAPDPLRPRSYRLIVRETPGFATEPPPPRARCRSCWPCRCRSSSRQHSLCDSSSASRSRHRPAWW